MEELRLPTFSSPDHVMIRGNLRYRPAAAARLFHDTLAKARSRRASRVIPPPPATRPITSPTSSPGAPAPRSPSPSARPPGQRPASPSLARSGRRTAAGLPSTTTPERRRRLPARAAAATDRVGAPGPWSRDETSPASQTNSETSSVTAPRASRLSPSNEPATWSSSGRGMATSNRSEASTRSTVSIEE